MFGPKFVTTLKDYARKQFVTDRQIEEAPARPPALPPFSDAATFLV